MLCFLRNIEASSSWENVEAVSALRAGSGDGIFHMTRNELIQAEEITHRYVTYEAVCLLIIIIQLFSLPLFPK